MSVDVLFPYYGDVDLMKTAVRSVLCQQYTDFRLIVVDDGYPDDGISGWFKSLHDSRVSYERNTSNLGANANYRKCLSLASADLIVFMGADDVMLPNYLQWLVARANEYPDAEVFQPGVFTIDQTGAPSSTRVEMVKSYYRPDGHGVRLLKGEQLAVSLLRGDWLYFPSLGWRREAVSKIGFRREYDVVQDLALVLDIVRGGGALVLDDTVAFHYRRHSGSDSSWRALEGTRFGEERAFFYAIAAEMERAGWRRAARVARLHLSSRLHAASLVPQAALARKWSGLGRLARHVTS